MNNTTKFLLSEIAEVQTGPFGSQLHMSDYALHGTPIITVEHFGENKIIHENLPLVSDTDKKRLIKYTLREGDVVFSRVGSVDRRVYVSSKENGWMFSGRCLRVRPKLEKVQGKYLSYYFGQESFKEYIRMNAVGATMPSINTQILSEAEVNIPDLIEQESIAEVLSSLDDKIDLLHRNNKTLEQLAETLFRQWFVEEAEDDWEVSTVGEQFDTKGGGTPSTTEPTYWDGNIFWTSPRDLSSSSKIFMRTTLRTISKLGLSKISSGLLPIGTVLLSSRAPIGYLAITDIEVSINQGYIACIPNAKFGSFYIHCWLKSNMDIIHSSSNGSTFMEISKNVFRQLEFIIPPDNLLSKFNNVSSSIYAKILSNEKQIKQLESLRDTLLPKLMSGLVKVRD